MEKLNLVISPDVLTAHLSGEAVLLNLADKNYYRLNETAALVWSGLERGASREEIVTSLVNNYEVDDAEAEKQMDAVIDDFRAKNLVTISRIPSRS